MLGKVWFLEMLFRTTSPPAFCARGIAGFGSWSPVEGFVGTEGIRAPGHGRKAPVRAEPSVASSQPGQGAAERITAKQWPVIAPRNSFHCFLSGSQLESLGSVFGIVALQGFQWKFCPK